MKKGLRILVMVLAMVSMMSCLVFADYTPALSINGQRWEAEPNDVDTDATIFYQTSTSIYPISGSIADVYDMDYYVYTSNTTQARTLRVGYSTTMNVSGTTGYLYLLDLTDDNLIYAQSVSISSSTSVPFQAIAGHEYIAMFTVDGSVDDIQARLDYLKTLNGKGFVYVLSIR